MNASETLPDLLDSATRMRDLIFSVNKKALNHLIYCSNSIGMQLVSQGSDLKNLDLRYDMQERYNSKDLVRSMSYRYWISESGADIFCSL